MIPRAMLDGVHPCKRRDQINLISPLHLGMLPLAASLFLLHLLTKINCFLPFAKDIMTIQQSGEALHLRCLPPEIKLPESGN